ncbi:MAG: hypothetical protein ACYC8T_01995 [Myxococcaceae bacterium]
MMPEELKDEPVEPGLVVKGGADALRPYLGRVIAVVEGEIRASGKTWAECLKAVREAHLVNPDLMFVPPAAFVG